MYFNIIFAFVAFLTADQLNTAAALRTRNEILRVLTVLNEPYVKAVDTSKSDSLYNKTEVTGDIEGYAVDLLNELSNEANFEYEIGLTNAYGSKDPNNNWNGMIGEVINGKADLAIGDLTVTQRREEDVDFSYPFMTTGIGLLVKRPPYFINDDENRNRTLLIYPVSQISDLPYQSEVEFGCVRSGATYEFFTHSNDEVFKLIGERMAANSTQLPVSSREAAERVKKSNGRFAFFMEGAAIEYLTAQNCDFMKLDENIHTRSYAIAMRKNFPLKTRINLGLLAMQERGALDRLKKKWFGQVKSCDDTLAAPYARNALNLVLRSIK